MAAAVVFLLVSSFVTKGEKSISCAIRPDTLLLDGDGGDGGIWGVGYRDSQIVLLDASVCSLLGIRHSVYPVFGQLLQL
jgi:hypothetical protein